MVYCCFACISFTTILKLTLLILREQRDCSVPRLLDYDGALQREKPDGDDVAGMSHRPHDRTNSFEEERRDMHAIAQQDHFRLQRSR